MAIAGGRVVVRPPRSWSALDRLFALAIGLGVGLTALLLAAGIHGHAILPTLDLVIDTIALVACAMLTALAWSRYQEQHEYRALYHAAAFLALTAGYGIAVSLSLQHGDSILGLSQPEEAQDIVFAIARLAAALLFVIADADTLRRTYGSHPTRVLIAPAAAVIVAWLLGAWLGPPHAALRIVVFADSSSLPQITPFGGVIHLLIASLFFAGAYVNRRVWWTGRAAIDGWVAIGLLFAGFAELHWILYPSAHPGQISTAAAFWLACSLTLLVGLESSVRLGLRDLRRANAELAELRVAEVEKAALEERARLARELHDGLAQDLWLARLRVGELSGIDDLPSDARRAADEAAAAIDVGLGEAREAVAALRSTAHVESGFCALVRKAAEDFGDRFGIRVEYSFEGDHTSRIDARVQAEVLRITQEAMTNAVRHASASVIGVRLGVNGARISLRIADNGRGFDPDGVEPGRFGLLSMRERAAIIGGRLRVLSRAGAGTRVILTASCGLPSALAEAAPR